MVSVNKYYDCFCEDDNIVIVNGVKYMKFECVG